MYRYILFSACLLTMAKPSFAKTPYGQCEDSTHLSLHLQHLVNKWGPDLLAESFAGHGWGFPMTLSDESSLPNSLFPLPEKQSRNAYSGNPQNHETENFAIWWGPEGDIRESDIAALGVELEHIWDVVIIQMDLPVPENSSSWKFNVYIGDTGEGVPSAEGNAGFFWYDTENHPMMVISSEIITWTDSAKLTAAHEFFHAVQASIGSYGFADNALWWKEATANWILEEIYFDEGGYSNTLYSVALRPEISLNHWGDYFTEGIEADHHYGASIFATYLSENHGGWETVVRTFTEAPANTDPLDVFEILLQETGANLSDAHLEYALRNTTWDYLFELDYEASVRDYTGGGESHRSSGVISGSSSSWHGPGDWPPHTFGSNNWELESMPEVFTITFEGDAGIDWKVGVASQTGDTHIRELMEVNDSEGQLVIRELHNSDELWLVVSAIDDNNDDGETHSYQFQITEGEPVAEKEEKEDEKPGGCTTNPLVPGNFLYALLLLLLALTSRHTKLSRKS